MTVAHRTEMIWAEDGKLALERLPFRAGQAVEVIVLPLQTATAAVPSLVGSITRYDRPTEPVAEADWDDLR